MTARLSGLGLALVRQKRLAADELEHVLTEAAAASVSFVEQLVLSRRLLARDVAEFAAHFFGYPYKDLSLVNVEAIPQTLLIEQEWWMRWRIIPLAMSKERLSVGASDPTLSTAFDTIRLMTGLAVEVYVVEDDKLSQVFQTILGHQVTSLLNETQAELSPLDIETKSTWADDIHPEYSDAPIMRLLRRIFQEAVRLGASDIHFVPYENQYRIRYRVDGQLRLAVQPSPLLQDRIAICLKVLARLDIAEKRVPQDGRLKWRLTKERSIDCRLSSLPTLFGEKIVLRILNEATVALEIDVLGLEVSQKELLLLALCRSWGMILVTGPTGSGKTVTLYSCLAYLNSITTNISTVEDPVEIILPGINQVNVNEKAGLTFAMVLRALVRQDPDVIMVGEIRDAETANIAIKAAQTGHLVLATLHTIDAPSAVVRLLNLGVAPFNVTNCVTLIIAQRLVRQFCPHCHSRQDNLIMANLEHVNTAVPPLCRSCEGTGYQGRVGVFEVMCLSHAISDLICAGGNAEEIARLANSDGMIDLRQAGLNKARQGTTSTAEVLAVTPGSS